MAPTATEEVKGVPPGLTAEPLEKTPVAQPKQAGAVKGVPAGLTAEPITATPVQEAPKLAPQLKPLTQQKVQGVPEGLVAHPAPLTIPETDQQKFYEQAVKNGFTPERAKEVTEREFGGTLAAPPPTKMERFHRVLSNIPVNYGKSAADVSDEIAGIGSHLNNPAGMSDEQWEERQKRQKAFIEDRIQKVAGEGVVGKTLSGAATGGAEFAEEMTSPVQIGLLVGTLGESALVRAAGKLGIDGAVPVARTLSKLVQAAFITQMADGFGQGVAGMYKSAKDGDWEGMGQNAIQALASGLMAGGLMSHEMAVDRVRMDLERKAREKYGPPEAHPFAQPVVSRFDQLDPYRQAAVIHETVRSTPEYDAILKGVEGKDEQAKAAAEKKNAQKLADYTQHAINQTWSPNAATRAFRWIDESRREFDRLVSEKTTKDAYREHYQKQIDEQLALEKEFREAEEERKTIGREQRPEKRSEAAKKREESRRVTLATAEQVSAARGERATARDDHERELTIHAAEVDKQKAEAPAVTRTPDEVTDDQGYVSYRGRTLAGDEHYFGPAQTPDKKWGVYRRTPDGIEYMGTGGIYEADPEEPFVAPNERTAKTIAQINSLRVNADFDLEEHGSTPERESERKMLRDLERELIDGSVTAEEARKVARLQEEAIPAEKPKPTASQEVEAARSGALNGPLHQQTRAQYEENFRAEAEQAGWDKADTDAYIAAFPIEWRSAAENNLHYVSRSGDWIASKKGITWVLDSKGMLRPDDGSSAPIPLMKNGRYTPQAIDLSMSGRVGFGQRSWETATIEDQQQKEADRQFENLTDKVAEEVQFAVEMSKQNAGLQLLPGEAPEATTPKRSSTFAPPVRELDMFDPERETQRAVEAGHAAEKAADRATTDAWINAMGDYMADHHEDAWGIIRRIAKNSGLSPQEVVRIQMERMAPEDTVDGKIAKLSPGDTISDKMRLPWVVERDAKGNLYMRSGDSQRVPLNPFKPSDTVRRIMTAGELIKAPGPHYTLEDIRKVAFEAPYVAKREASIEEVKARATGEVKDPEPVTTAQAVGQAVAAKERAEDVTGAAIVDTVKAADPVPGTTVDQAVAAVDKAEETKQTAEQAKWQEIQAKSKTYEDKPFPPRAPISMGERYTGHAGIIKHLGQSYAFHYGLVPLDSVVSSHIWEGNVLVPNPDFDEVLQPRTISETRSAELVLEAQLRQSETAKGYDFDYYGDKTISPLTGPAILESGGRVPGGNTRIAIQRKHLEIIRQIDNAELRDIHLQSFRSRMAKLASESGIGGYPLDDRDYTVARILDEPITTERDAALKGLFFNSSPSTEITEAAKGVALARQLGDRSLADIGRMLDEHDTLGAAIADNPHVFTDIVKRELGVQDTEDAQWFTDTSKGKVLSENGRRKFAQVLMGKVFQDTSVMEALQGTPAYTAVERAVINIIRMKATKNEPMVQKIIEAVHAAKTTWNTGIAGEGVADRWESTYDPKATSFDFAVTDIPPMPDKVVEAIWRSIHAGPRTLSDRVKTYNETDRPSKSTGLDFEQEGPDLETPTERFNRIFGKEINKKAVGKPKDKVTEAEYNAAMENRGDLSEQEIKEAERVEQGLPPEERRRPDMSVIRADIEKMSPEEMKREIEQLREERKTDELTGLPNKKGFDYAEKQKKAAVIGVSDMVGLKAFNDEYGDVAGDRALKAMGEALKRAGLDAYRIHGDEIAYRADSEEELRTKLEQARTILKNTGIDVEKAGVHDKFTGVDISYGMGKDYNSAFAEMNEAKKARKTKRGEFGDIKATGKMEPPPLIPREEEVKARAELDVAKAERGYATVDDYQKLVETHPSTKKNAADIMLLSRVIAKHFFDPAEGEENEDPLAWGLRNSVSKLVGKKGGTHAGSFETPAGEELFAKGVLTLYDAANETTLLHELMHAFFRFLSRDEMLAIDTLEGPKGANGKPLFPKWDGKLESLTGDVLRGVSEKASGGLEVAIRDENPTGFSAPVKKVLAKLKAVFTDVYKLAIRDPLAAFKLTVDARGVYAKMLHMEEFDAPTDFKKKMEAARKEETKQKVGMTRPGEAKDPVEIIANDFNAKGIRESMDGAIINNYGDRVDPNKPEVTLFYPDISAVTDAVLNVGASGASVQGSDLIQAPDGSYGLRINVKKKPPSTVFYQEIPQKDVGQLGLERDKLKKKLADLPESAPMIRDFLQKRIAQLEAEIRIQYGIASPKFGPDPETARKAIAEVKREGTSEAGRPRVSDLRGVPDESDRSGQKAVGRITKPPVMGMPGHASAPRAADKPRTGPTSLANVKAVTLVPFDKPRGESVGILAGDKFDEKAWRDGLKKAGLPENLPAPTVTLSREVAQVLKFAGQKQIVQMALSALEQSDGAIIASATGTGKTYTELAVAKETLLKNPNAKILLITKNRGLLKAAAKTAKEHYSMEMEVDAPKGALGKNLYGASYQRLLGNPIYKETHWDLVISDESGEARNWHLDENQQGKLLMAVMQNADKGLYVSATPFHSPNEYGYLEKLNLWPKGQFQNWIKENFAHEKIGDKIIAKLDPGKQAKFRQQLIERGQMVSQEISYDGFTVHFGVVPIDDMIERKLDRIHQGIAVARRELLAQGKKGLAERIAAFEATYTKAFLERSRLPQAIELARKALDAGWHPLFFSETTSEDLFRRPVGPKEEPGTYRKLDDESGGLISRIMPEFPNIMDELRSAFGDDIGDYSGLENTDAQREENKAAYLRGSKPMLYTSYAAGGIGVSLHDEDGDKPRFSIFLGPPYSGVLLEQAMGRTWRFGVKSNAMAVFLATDSEPDIRLMATKVGPRMRALRASVLGERDSLAAVMAGYSDEQKMREQQDLLAFDQGNEVKVDAQNFQVRSKRKVNFDNWSAITVPSAEGAKNKGMQVEMSGAGKGDDWTTLYQEKPKRWEPPNRPLTIEDIKIRRAINAAADEAAKNPQIPSGEIAMSAIRAKIQAEGAPEDVDKEAVARDVIVSHLKGISYTQDPLTGEYKTAEQIEPTTEKENPERDQTYRAALGLTSSQEQNLIYLDRQMKTDGAGRELVTKTRRYTAIDENQTAELRTEFSKIMRDSGLNPHDEKVMRDIFDVVMNKRTVADPYINKAASEIRPMMARIQRKGAEENLSTITPDGRLIPWKDFNPDPSYMPRMADWDAKFTDGTNTYTLREIMGEGFGEERAKRLIEEKFKKEGRTDTTADAAFLAVKRTRLRAPRQGNIHYTNEVNFPFIRKDLGALDNYFRQFAKAVATEREFGSDLGKLRKEIAKIPNERARTDVENMFGYMFTPQNWDSDLGKFYNFMSGAESWTKMTFSATKVLYHAGNLHTVLSGQVMPVASAIGHTFLHWREARDNAYMIGTIMEGVDPALMNLPETKSQRYAFKATGFEKLYNLGRVIAGETARSYLDKYAMKDLKKGGKSEENTRRLLRNTFLIGDAAIDTAMQTGKWGEEEYKLAQVGFANESMYGKNPLQMPKAARRRISGQHMDTFDRRLNMALRASYSLQSFSVKTYSMLREHLWDEVMIHHNYKPLAYAMIITPIIGQMLQGTGAGAKHFVKAGFEKARGREHEEDSWDKWLAQFTDIKDKPAAALLKIYIDGLCSQWALERTKRLADAMLNIAIGDKPSLKSAKATGMYLLNDEIEQDIGPIWVDTVMRPIKFAGEEIEAGAGKAGTFVGKSFSNLVHNTMDAYPLLRNSPDVEDLTKKRPTGSIYAP